MDACRSGVVGTPSTPIHSMPRVQVPAVAIAAGERHTVVVTAKGAVLVFGDAAGGQLALGDWVSGRAAAYCVLQADPSVAK